MQVVVTGASSALGQATLRAIVAQGVLTTGAGNTTPVRRIIAVDRTQPAALFLDSRVEYVRGDYEQPRFLARMMGTATDSVFHLSALGAGTVAGPEPVDLSVALLRSFDTTRVLLEACRFQSTPPKFILASTTDVRPESGPWPQDSEGVYLALCELLVVEGSRHRVVDARCVRLPCVVGNRSCSHDLALQALLVDLAAGRAAQEAAQALTDTQVISLEQAAAALLAAHERPATRLDRPDFVDVAGRRVRIGELAMTAAPVAGAPDSYGPGPTGA